MWPAVGIALFTGLVNVMNVWNAACVRLAPAFRLPSRRCWPSSCCWFAGMVVLQAGQQFVVYPKRLESGGSGGAGCSRAAGRSKRSGNAGHSGCRSPRFVWPFRLFCAP